MQLKLTFPLIALALLTGCLGTQSVFYGNRGAQIHKQVQDDLGAFSLSETDAFLEISPHSTTTDFDRV